MIAFGPEDLCLVVYIAGFGGELQAWPLDSARSKMRYRRAHATPLAGRISGRFRACQNFCVRQEMRKFESQSQLFLGIRSSKRIAKWFIDRMAFVRLSSSDWCHLFDIASG